MLYAFLSSFFWMLVEGIHVYLMVVKVFKGSRKMKAYMLIGWCKYSVNDLQRFSKDGLFCSCELLSMRVLHLHK